MAKTEIRGAQIKDTSVQRADLDVSTTGSAVVTRLVAGTNITFGSTGVDTGTGDVTINASGGGSGVARSILSIAVNTTLGSTASTDYVYFCSSTISATLPTAVGNTNRYTIINSGTDVITVVGTISGATNDVLYSQYEVGEYQSNGTNWYKIN